jgi:DNA-binding beta-propeller fold protein YncE
VAGQTAQASATYGKSFPNLNAPSSIAYDPDNGHLYVTSENYNSYSGTITVYDAQGNQITGLAGDFPIPNSGLPISPIGITYNPENGYLYVTQVSIIPVGTSASAITVYDAQGNQVVP